MVVSGAQKRVSEEKKKGDEGMKQFKEIEYLDIQAKLFLIQLVCSMLQLGNTVLRISKWFLLVYSMN